MGKTYSEKLKDPRWQRMRLEVLARDGWKCSMCDDGKKTLHVHHEYYVSGREPWEYPTGSLHSLCEDCHDTAKWWSGHRADTVARALEVRRYKGDSEAPERRVAADLALVACRLFDYTEDRRLPDDLVGQVEVALNDLRFLQAALAELHGPPDWLAGLMEGPANG